MTRNAQNVQIGTKGTRMGQKGPKGQKVPKGGPMEQKSIFHEPLVIETW